MFVDSRQTSNGTKIGFLFGILKAILRGDANFETNLSILIRIYAESGKILEYFYA